MGRQRLHLSGSCLLWLVLKGNSRLLVAASDWERKKKKASARSTREEDILFPLSVSPSHSLLKKRLPHFSKTRQKPMCCQKTHPSSCPSNGHPREACGSEESSSQARAGSAPGFAGAETPHDPPCPAPPRPSPGPRPSLRLLPGPRWRGRSWGRLTCGRRGAGPSRPERAAPRRLR